MLRREFILLIENFSDFFWISMCGCISDSIERTDSLVCLGKKAVYIERFESNMNELILYQLSRFLILCFHRYFVHFVFGISYWFGLCHLSQRNGYPFWAHAFYRKLNFFCSHNMFRYHYCSESLSSFTFIMWFVFIFFLFWI